MQQMKSRIAGLVLVAVSACTGGGATHPPTGATVEALGSPTLTTDAATYQPVGPITTSWDNLPGNALDWVALAPAGSDLTTSVAWCYTGATVTGSHTFAAGLVPGSYVARAFADDGYALIVESAPFTVSAVGLAADKAAYFPGEQIAVTWSGLPGNAHDWVAIAPQGADPTTVTAWVYTAGASGGMQTFSGLTAPGTYVARAFVDDSYTAVNESTPFTVAAGAATVTTDTTTYAFRQSVVVSWTGLAGTATDWIALAPAGGALTAVDRWVYTGGATSGTVTLETPTSTGNFTARAFTNGTYTLAGESAQFTVDASSLTLATTTDASTYTADQPITVSWTGLQGVPLDWVALAPAGSAMTTVTRWLYAGSAASGSLTFTLGLSTPGSYVARTFSNDTYTLVQESAAFTVQ
jgi:hypothetical protein